MKLKKCLQNLNVKEIKGFSKELEILGVCNDSRKVFPQALFIAKRGQKYDGNQFIPLAIEAGATCILTDLFDPFLKNIVQVICDDVAQAEADLADAFYESPSKKLSTIGVTGTKGKTTTTYLIKHFLDCAKKPCGLIGTVETIVKENHYSSERTTPDILSLQKVLKEMVLAECQAAVMEVSSHGLDQERVKHIFFSQAILTNLQEDHFDYHKTKEAYLEAKLKLFKNLDSESFAILNQDDLIHFPKFFAASKHAKIFTYGINAKNADLRASHIELYKEKTRCILTYQNESVPVESPLLGRFNVYNLLAAASSAIVSGISLKKIAEALAAFSQVPGRFQKVAVPRPIHVIVDYAHTEDSLSQILQTLIEFKNGHKIITVFGCGGDRDKQKRPKMGKVSEKFSDFTILTADNPRSEDPENICQEIAQGFSKNFSNFLIETDRKEAIKKAVNMALDHDIVLIAGKGHEKTQTFSTHTALFDDVKIVKEICQ